MGMREKMNNKSMRSHIANNSKEHIKQLKMSNREKLNEAWTLLYKTRKERNAPFDNFSDDPIANNLLHAMKSIEEANEDLGDE
jgi:hypothetical protein